MALPIVEAPGPAETTGSPVVATRLSAARVAAEGSSERGVTAGRGGPFSRSLQSAIAPAQKQATSAATIAPLRERRAAFFRRFIETTRACPAARAPPRARHPNW